MGKPLDDGPPRRSSIDHALRAERDAEHREIRFVPATRPDTHMDQLKRKYIALIPKEETQARGATSSATKGAAANGKAGDGDAPVQSGLLSPKRILFPDERVVEMLSWRETRKIGCGLANLGNTCFLNSVLQCLTYTPPLANYMLTGEHGRQCRAASFCAFCEMERHVQRALGGGAGGAIRPKNIIQNLKNIGKQFRFGRQEDSHEFLRYVVDGMQKSCLLNAAALQLDERSKETTFVHRVFGGHLRSQVKCSVCAFESDVFEPFLDLSLEIKRCSSVERAFSHFTRPEILEKDNAYKCSRCAKKVTASKRLTVYRAPKVLTVQLKRFDYTGKIGSFVEFKETLDIAPYMSEGQTDRPKYRLYAVLVHSGFSCHSGHYYCFVRNSNNVWYSMNDSSVQQVSLNQVLKQHAYLLMYVRADAAPAVPRPVAQANGASKVVANGTPKTPIAAPPAPVGATDVGERLNREKAEAKLRERAAMRTPVANGAVKTNGVNGHTPVSSTTATANGGSNGVNGITSDVQSVTQWEVRPYTPHAFVDPSKLLGFGWEVSERKPTAARSDDVVPSKKRAAEDDVPSLSVKRSKSDGAESVAPAAVGAAVKAEKAETRVGVKGTGDVKVVAKKKWDGKRDDSVREVFSASSFEKMGGAVLGWNDSANTVDAVDVSDESDSRRRRKRDEIDEMIDRGHVKRVKKERQESHGEDEDQDSSDGPKINPFQAAQTRKNEFKRSHGAGGEPRPNGKPSSAKHANGHAKPHGNRMNGVR